MIERVFEYVQPYRSGGRNVASDQLILWKRLEGCLRLLTTASGICLRDARKPPGFPAVERHVIPLG